MVMGSLPITVPPKEPEEAPSPRRGFFFSGFGFRGTPVPSENLIRHVTWTSPAKEALVVGTNETD